MITIEHMLEKYIQGSFYCLFFAYYFVRMLMEFDGRQISMLIHAYIRLGLLDDMLLPLAVFIHFLQSKILNNYANKFAMRAS